jgi:hypothetical protein
MTPTETNGTTAHNPLEPACPTNADKNEGSQFPVSDGMVGILLFLAFFALTTLFSVFLRTFYTDDHVVQMAPLMIEEARQIMNGHAPLYTWYVGGGGGTPLLPTVHGILDPFAMIPALLFHDHPEIMINTIVSLHLALFAAGGWVLGRSIGAPRWASLVAAAGFGFSAVLWFWGVCWIALVAPYSFLPWLLAALARLAEAESSRKMLFAQALCAASMLGLFCSGVPNCAFHSGPVVLLFLACLLLRHPGALKKLGVRLIPQVALLCIIVVPLLFEARKVYEFYGRITGPEGWEQFSVPLQAYAGLFAPYGHSYWSILWANEPVLLSNAILHVGMVPVWYSVFILCRDRSASLFRTVAPLIVGIVVFVAILSPHQLHLSSLWASLPGANIFRHPFRSLPAFLVLVMVLFLVLAAATRAPGKRSLQALLVVACVAGGIFAVGGEFWRGVTQKSTDNWFWLTAPFSDTESWDPATLERMRRAGNVLSLCENGTLYFAKPRLFFHGNLGAQYRVPCLSIYMFGQQCTAREEIGMHYRGVVQDWDKAKDFLSISLARPSTHAMRWENGIGPQSLAELAAKTYVGVVVVERAWKDPMTYFQSSATWKRLAETPYVVAFVRNAPRNGER